MKFLVISQQKDNVPPATEAEREKNIKSVEQAIKDGKILEMYYIPGWNKAISIEEHENMGEILEAISISSKFNNFEIYPLMEWTEAGKILYK